jgi:putative transposase
MLYTFTFTIVEWLPVFVSDDPCQIVVESLNFCHREKSLRTNAYVLMPTHLHAILFDADMNAHRLAKTITALRKYTGRQLCDYCTTHLPVFDRVLREVAVPDRERQFWQPSRHPEAIYRLRFWRQKIGYLQTIRAARGWCARRTIGAIRRRRIGRVYRRNPMSFLHHWSGSARRTRRSGDRRKEGRLNVLAGLLTGSGARRSGDRRKRVRGNSGRRPPQTDVRPVRRPAMGLTGSTRE